MHLLVNVKHLYQDARCNDKDYQRSIPFGCIHLLLVHGIKFLFLPFFWWGWGCCSVFTSDAEGSGVFVAEEADGLGGKKSGDSAVENFSRFATIFLKYSSIRISCVSAS